MTLSPEEFLRRFLQHVLPKGFPRIRYFGWLANRARKRLLQLALPGSMLNWSGSDRVLRLYVHLPKT